MSPPLTKSCYRCKVTKTMEEFHFDKHSRDGFVNICKGCAKQRDRAKYLRVREKQIKNARRWNITHPEQYKDYQLRRSFGITLIEYRKMLDEQRGVCAICAQVDTKALAVDHDAWTGVVRGLLCRSCNQAIGLLRHLSSNCEAAARYLKRHAAKEEVPHELLA